MRWCWAQSAIWQKDTTQLFAECPEVLSLNTVSPQPSDTITWGVRHTSCHDERLAVGRHGRMVQGCMRNRKDPHGTAREDDPRRAQLLVDGRRSFLRLRGLSIDCGARGAAWPISRHVATLRVGAGSWQHYGQAKVLPRVARGI